MKTLQKRLAGLYTVTTSSILLLVIVSFLLTSYRDIRTTQLEQFRIIWNSLSSRFLSSNSLTHAYLAQTETDYQMIIYITENGIPFFYRGSWQPGTDREILIEKTCLKAESEGISMNRSPVSSTSVTSSLMTIEGQNHDQYYAMVLVQATKNGAKSLCAISFVPSVWESLRNNILYLCPLTVTVIVCLWFISWKFVGWSLKPVEESRQKQARFIASASHELRSPLAVLRTAVTAIGNAPEETDRLLPLIDNECVRMSRLIDDMLLLASADAKTWNIYIKEVDMDTLLIELYESFRLSCLEKEISLYLELPEETLPPVSGDPERIRQILLILLDNARNYTPAGRSIYIRALIQKKRQSLILQVIDQGCGIPPENRPYIFDRFYQADPARSDKKHFGLGLSIAKELTELHHGRITLDNNTDGGCCFSVYLPYLRNVTSEKTAN